jgi:hypothetical protein
MAIVCLLLSAGLAYAAFVTNVSAARKVWVICMAMNVGAASHMIATDFKYAYRLAPNIFNERPERIR